MPEEQHVQHAEQPAVEEEAEEAPTSTASRSHQPAAPAEEATIHYGGAPPEGALADGGEGAAAE
eukprot:5370323-Pyramimonas_sp.AAC.1